MHPPGGRSQKTPKNTAARLHGIPLIKLVRPSIGSLPLSLLVAAWIILAVNDDFRANTVRAFAIGMSALLTALSISVTVKYITKPIYIVALFSAAAASWIMQKLGVIIDNHMIRNATQTTPAGAGHLMTPAWWTRPCRVTNSSTLCLG